MKKPHTVRHLESVISGVLQEHRKNALIHNAKQPFEQQFKPSAIRMFWESRIFVHWCDYRSAWVICDNFETGVSSLCFYPQREQWTLHKFMSHFETDLTHEQAESLALSLYKTDNIRRFPAVDYQ